MASHDYERRFRQNDDRGDYERSDYRRDDYGTDREGPRSGGFRDAYARRASGGADDHSYGRDRGMWDRPSDEYSSWYGNEMADERRMLGEARRDQRMRQGTNWGMDQGMERQRGEHRGRGPRAYTRSDERIHEDVNDRLTDDDRVDASDIEVMVSNGEVTLSGAVDDRSAKRRAEECLDDIPGIRHVQNNLRVHHRDQGRDQGRDQDWNEGRDRDQGREARTAAGASAMAGLGTGGQSGGTQAATGSSRAGSTSR